MGNIVFEMIANFVARLPLFLVIATGITLALTRKDEHPKASRLVLIALALMTVVAGFSAVMWAILPQLVFEHLGFEMGRWILVAFNFFLFLLDAVVIGLLVLAAFSVPVRVVRPNSDDGGKPHRDKSNWQRDAGSVGDGNRA